jgi:hypothetical protein
MLKRLISFVILIVTLGLLGGGSYYLYQYFEHQPKKVNSYQDIVLGDSKDQVFYALGKPSRVLLPGKEESAPEIIVGKETLENNPDHEKAYNHWQYLSAKTVTDVLFDSKSKKTVTIGCSKLSDQPAFETESIPEPTLPTKGKKAAIAPPVSVIPPPASVPPPPPKPPLTPAQAAEAPAADTPPPPLLPPPSAAGSPPGEAPAPDGAAPPPAAPPPPPPPPEASACNIIGIKIGDHENDVLARLGRPKKETYDGIYKTIIYPNFNLAIKMEKRVVIYIKAVKEVLTKPPVPAEGEESKEGKEK